MKAADAINLLQFLPSPAGEEFTSKLKTGKSGLLSLEAEHILEQANQEDKHNANILARKIILEFELGESPIADLNQLIAAGSTTEEKVDSAQVKLLAETCQALYGSNQNKSNVKRQTRSGVGLESMAVIEKSLTPGWFTQRAWLRFYMLNHQPEHYQDLLTVIRDKTWNFVFRLALLSVGGVTFGLAGLVVIAWQLFF